MGMAMGEGGRSCSPRVSQEVGCISPLRNSPQRSSTVSTKPLMRVSTQKSSHKQANNSIPCKVLLILQTHLHSAVFNQYIPWLYPPAPTPSSNSGGTFKMHRKLSTLRKPSATLSYVASQKPTQKEIHSKKCQSR